MYRKAYVLFESYKTLYFYQFCDFLMISLFPNNPEKKEIRHLLQNKNK
jgi:hypothetical protein